MVDKQLLVKGLVQDRLQKLDRGKAVLSNRVCRTSLDIVCDQTNDPKMHQNQELWTDPTDGVIDARNQIHWFLK